MNIIHFFLAAFVVLSTACNAESEDERLVEGLRGMQPGGLEFGDYKDRVIARGSEIVPELIATSYDNDADMRRSAARCLGHIGTDRAVRRLIEMADDDVIEETVWIAMSYSRSPLAIPKLEEELATHSDSKATGRILLTLADCGDRSRLGELLHMVQTTELPGHVYHGQEVFERIAGRQFSSIEEIRFWLLGGPADASHKGSQEQQARECEERVKQACLMRARSSPSPNSAFYSCFTATYGPACLF